MPDVVCGCYETAASESYLGSQVFFIYNINIIIQLHKHPINLSLWEVIQLCPKF
jgi:hypothetical protein